MHNRKTSIPFRWMLAAALAVVGASPALAVGPVDVEVGVAYWQQDYTWQTDPGDFAIARSADDLGYWGKIWAFNWGLSAAQFKGNWNGGTTDYLSIDLMRKVIHPTRNNYLALGVGWQQIDYQVDIGTLVASTDSTGARLVADARVGLIGMLYAYGNAAYLFGMSGPDFDDNKYGTGDGIEYEFGLAVKPAPFLWLRVGYRLTRVSWNFAANGDSYTDTRESDGYLAALSLTF